MSGRGSVEVVRVLYGWFTIQLAAFQGQIEVPFPGPSSGILPRETQGAVQVSGWRIGGFVAHLKSVWAQEAILYCSGGT